VKLLLKEADTEFDFKLYHITNAFLKKKSEYAKLCTLLFYHSFGDLLALSLPKDTLLYTKVSKKPKLYMVFTKALFHLK
jgi:hypothetical protein